MKGWIKLYRSLIDWEWHDIPEMVSLFFHLIALANYEDKKWHGITIKRGQLVTSNDKLSSIVGISARTLRTCLSKLEETGEIDKQTTNKFTVITICKYDYYQSCEIDDFAESDKQTTNKRQTTDKQPTTTKEYKEYKNNNIAYANSAHARAREKLIAEAMIDIRIEQGCKSLGIGVDRYKELVDAVINDWEYTNIPDSEWTMAHLLQTMRIKNNVKKREQNGQQSTYISDPVARRNYERNQRLQAVAARAAALGAQGEESNESLL